MGNRAVIISKKDMANGKISPNQIGVYLHWNGGYDSVSAFLKYCEYKSYRTPDTDCYGWARLCQVIGNFFGGTTSLGIDCAKNLDCDNGDNGVYIIEGWNIVGRKYYFNSKEQNYYNISELLKEIDRAQPESEQLGELFWTAKELPLEAIDLGDRVFIQNYDGTFSLETITSLALDYRFTPCYEKDGRQIPITTTFGGSCTNNIFRVLK